VLDPIDGTSNFVAGRPLWGTHVALQVGGEIVVGVITRPVLGASWWASRGGGAHRADSAPVPSTRRLQVSRVQQLRESRVTLWTHQDDPTIQSAEPELPLGPSQPGRAAATRGGELEALVDRSGKPWDRGARGRARGRSGRSLLRP
jgi:histidinol-phosphatase